MSLQSIITEETARGRFRGQVEFREGNQFSGMISNFDDPKILIGIDSSHPNLEPIFRAILRHEINHQCYSPLKGCPRNLDMHISILSSVSEVLATAGYSNVPITPEQSLYHYMANLFTDFVDNSQLGRTIGHSGIWTFYKYSLDQKKISPLFDAFLRLQEYTYGNKNSKKLLRLHHTNDPRVIEAVRTFISDSNLQRTNIDSKLDSDDYQELSRIFTEKLMKLIDPEMLLDPTYVSSTFLPLEAKLFPSELDNPEVKMPLVFRSYQSSEGEFDPPKFLERTECLKLLYQRLARNLELRVHASSRTTDMPLIHIGTRPFEIEDPIDRVKVGFDGQLRLNIGKHPITIPVSYQTRPSSLPEIQFALLDTSSSTQKNLGVKSHPKVLNPWAQEEYQWTDDSIYHYELLAWFGLLEYLRKQGALRQTSVKLANFSNSVLYAPNLTEAYRIALSPQFGGTQLSNVQSLFGSPVPKKLIFTLSDGQIFNWSSIKEEFIRNAKRHFYFHLQVGSENIMTQDLLANNIPVFYDDGQNLGKLIIDLTKPFVSRGVA